MNWLLILAILIISTLPLYAHGQARDVRFTPNSGHALCGVIKKDGVW
jgi:hypothetical protein